MPATCVLKVCRTAEGLLIRVEGLATMKQSPALRQFTDQSLDKNPAHGILLDLAACDYLDSTFLGCIVGLHRRCGPPHASQTPRLWVCADGPAPPAARPDAARPHFALPRVAPPVYGEWIAPPPPKKCPARILATM